MTDHVDIEAAKLLVCSLNEMLARLPGYRVASHGTRLELREANGHYHDAGLDCVAEFHAKFTAHLASEPSLPKVSEESWKRLKVYAGVAAWWGEQLKSMAQDAAQEGDDGGSLLLIRLQLCQEELAELADGMVRRDIVDCLDALTDMTYVCDGTYLTLGLGHYKLAALAEVHRSNMSKIGDNGKPITSSAGRIVKGPNYVPPDLKGVMTGVNRLASDADNEALLAFYHQLERHDWWYSMSEDPSVWGRGSREESQLRGLMKRGGPAWRDLYNAFENHVKRGGPKPQKPGDA